jgi:endo-1,3-1,4-beta-glycanase ExoK
MKCLLCFLVMAALTLTVSAQTSSAIYNMGRNYGRWDARMRFDFMSGTCPCFYLIQCPGCPSTGTWHEIDIEFVQDPNQFASVPHCLLNNYQPCCFIRFNSPLTSAYHTYTIIHTPTLIEWQCDGNPVRRAQKQANGSILHQYFATSAAGSCPVGSKVETNNWLDDYADASMEVVLQCWSGSGGWTLDWTDQNCGKLVCWSWFKEWNYTPGAGPDGSDFTLNKFDSFDGSTLDRSFWTNVEGQENIVLRDGKLIMVQNCNGVTGTTKTPWADPGDSSATAVIQGKGGARPVFSRNTVAFNGEHAGDASLSFFDLRGKLIGQGATLKNQSFAFDRRNMAPGVCAAVLKNGSTKSTWKMENVSGQ